MSDNSYDARINQVLDALGISIALIAQKRLPPCPEARQLVVAEVDASGREYLLDPAAATAWIEMKRCAEQDGVILEIVSAYRSIERQIDIIQGKLGSGMPIETVLTLSAPPGYSEHHTGRAVDINTPGCAATEEPFEDTAAFGWLMQNASGFRFTLSYPRGNPLGFIYEPWHWCFQPDGGRQQG